jgi:transposase
MLSHNQRTTILELHARGMPRREIARTLGLSRKAVGEVIRSGRAEVPTLVRTSRLNEHRELIRQLFASCRSNLVRVHEELVAETKAAVSYAALTAFCRREGIGTTPKIASGEYDFAPGQEMQHDTSPHQLDILGKLRAVQTASAVLCYSRRLLFQFYPSFTRFECKLFLTDGFEYNAGVTEVVLVDNTSVIVGRGTGRDMVPAPEMAAFAMRYGFEFRAHEKGHADRKGRVEAPFRFIERNFLAGRSFRSLEDANERAREWCNKVNATYKKHIRAVPNELFAAERPCLHSLPSVIPEVYRLHHRVVDVYAYVNLHTNRYSVPDDWVLRPVEVLEYKTRLEITDGGSTVRHHPEEPGAGKRVRLPEHRRVRPAPEEKDGGREEKRLLALAPDAPQLLAYARALKLHGRRQPTLALRQLLRIVEEYPRTAVLCAVQTAAAYGLYDLDRLERMVLRAVARDFFPPEDES